MKNDKNTDDIMRDVRSALAQQVQEELDDEPAGAPKKKKNGLRVCIRLFRTMTPKV